MKNRFILIFLFLLSLKTFAYDKGGIITWKHLGGYTYKITITTLTEINSPGGNEDRCKLTLNVNHADSLILPRINGPLTTSGGECVGTNNGLDINSTSKLNIYEGTYTFPCEGIFTLSCMDGNRQAIYNIPNSVNTQQYFESEIVVPKSNYQCSSNSIDLQLKDFILNNLGNQKIYPLIFNPNGDSLVYSLIPCQFNNGQNIPGYVSTGFSINSTTGEITWNNTSIAEYGVCVKTKVYRLQEYIGSVNYDFPVKVLTTTTNAIFNGFSSNLSPINDVFELNPSQTFSLSGTNANSNSIDFNLTSEITESTTNILNPSTFSLSITYSVSAAKK